MSEAAAETKPEVSQTANREASVSRADPALFVRLDDTDHQAKLDLVVQSMHCAGCMRRIERALGELD
ncbi:heavy metal-associated domain-containing protein, partial [Parvibaculum sp.]|uniref:heavy-metal-associated domain-containing protein n=1 Tax=Parvibaculum sp. TaxID=2024848 RepID=UPI002CB3EFC4